MARGHIELNGQSYIVQDESLISKIVPMFRPQLVVEGISREAQDQYLYMAWDTWDRGSYYQARTTGRWINGGFGRIDGIDNSIENNLQLQRRTTLSLNRPFVNSLPNATRLVSIGGWILAFSENGDVRRLGVAGSGKTVVASDNFNRANETLAAGPNWAAYAATIGTIILTNVVENGTSAGLIDANVWNGAGNFTGDQYAKCKIVNLPTPQGFVGLTLRGNANPAVQADDDYYLATARGDTGGKTHIFKVVDGVTTAIAGPVTTAWAVNDIMEFQAIGSTLTVFRNGTSVLSVVDTTYTSGSPGLSATFSSGSTGPRLDDWEAGNIDVEADGWEVVNYDSATNGAICFADVATTSGGGPMSGLPGGAFESKPRLLLGTLTGKVFFADVELDDVTGLPELNPVSVQAFFTNRRIYSAVAYRNQVAVGGENRVLVRPIDQNGVWQSGDTLNINLPGAPVAMAVWNQLIMIACQVSSRGSVIIAASISQAIDTYRVDGGFTIQSMTTWGGQLVYGGKAFRSSEVYSFPGTRADTLPPGATPTDVLALYATHRHVMVGWNGHGGVWWMHDKGTGALAQFDAANATATDNWDRVDNNSLGANWTEQENAATAIQISTNQLRFLFGNGGAVRSGTWLNNQFAKMKFVSGTGDGGGPAVRVTLKGGGNITGYMARVNTVGSQTIELVRYNDEAMSGTGIVLRSVNQTVVANDVIEIRVEEQTITIKRNGLTVIAEVDSAIGLGSPGIFGRGASGEQRWDNWEGQDFLAGTHRRTRSVVVHRGEVFYSLDSVGVIRANITRYRSSGEITSNWFDGGFPELQKNFADVFVRLKRPLTVTETVTLSARVDGKAEVTVGSVAQGRIDATFPLPASLQQGKRINLRITLGNTASPATTTPVVTACVLRYRPIPVQQRVWGFTVKAADNLLFLDGSRERRKPDQIISDLFALPTTGQVDFSTVLEPTIRKVYVTNVELKDQLLGRSHPVDFEESHIAVEILEASAVLDNAVITSPPQLDTEALPLEDPDHGSGDDLQDPGAGSGPPGDGSDRMPEWPFDQP